SIYKQIAYGNPNNVLTPPEWVSGNQWKFFLSNPSLMADKFGFQVGDLIGVKAKHDGNTFFFLRANHVTFENIKWTHSTREVARSGSSYPTFRRCRIERAAPINGQTPCMSSNGGGPQINQPNDMQSKHILVESCYFDSPGDDCIAFFPSDSSRIVN